MDFNEILGVIKEYADMAVEQAGKVGKAAATKTESTVQKAKVKYGIAEIENKKKEIYETMGQKLYMDYLQNGTQIENLEEDYKKIDDLNEDLEDLKSKLSEYKESVKCSYCGSNNDSENIYCSKCGKKLANDENKSSYEPNYYDVDSSKDDETVIEVSKSTPNLEDDEDIVD